MSVTRKPMEWTDEAFQSLLEDVQADPPVPQEHLDDGQYIGGLGYRRHCGDSVSIWAIWGAALYLGGCLVGGLATGVVSLMGWD